MTEQILDQAERDAAIDPARSFIVQAPAGSGKTSLLTQRFLRLLATVRQPEEVLAITFTRKAAGEMRQRISGALQQACSSTPPADAHEHKTWQLARAVHEHARSQDWNLGQHPSRLRVMTLDAFNASLLRQMPLLSGTGGIPAIADDSRELYELAARRTIEQLESGERWSTAIEALLVHLDNRLDRAEALLADMLARRDQWLPRLLAPGGSDRERLEGAFRTEIEQLLAQLVTFVPARFSAEIISLAAFAAAQWPAVPARTKVQPAAALASLPGSAASELPAWRALGTVLLVQDGKLRKAVDARCGFPKEYQAEKLRMQELLTGLAGHEDFRHALAQVCELPPAEYSDVQWLVLDALRELLPVAAGMLQLVFSERGQVDHVQVALSARRALGEEEQPTDLALALDHRISHILVDEFQDTSTSQYQLLEALTRGFSPGDGRSLFLVGDPMQSIYRFREAEVGLFLRARYQGIGQLPLQFLALRVNFRSRRPLVDWVNRHFPKLLAVDEDPASGAIPFAPASANDQSSEGGVAVHAQGGPKADPQAEAATIARLVQQRLAETANGTVAILVQTRRRVASILPALRAAGIAYQAMEIETLASRPVVQDLLALSRALIHAGDRTAWLAILRAPWCGLSLAALHQLAGNDHQRTIPALLRSGDRLERLDADSRQRLERILPPLFAALDQQRRGSLRNRVEVSWEALGGPAVAGDAAALEDALAYLDLLEANEVAADLDDANILESALAALYARAGSTGTERVQVLTMHKAKGLEFDTAILPGLHSRPRSDDPQLLLWTERPRLGPDPELLLAPIRSATTPERDPHYQLVEQLVREKQGHELGRLLYVAVTRAVRRLDLCGWCAPDKTPPGGSLLARLWPVLEQDFLAARSSDETATEPDPIATATLAVPLTRLVAGWQAPPAHPAVPLAAQGAGMADRAEAAVEYSWAGDSVRLAGLVTHRLLQQIASDGLARWSGERLAGRRPAIVALLRSQGADAEQLETLTERVLSALSKSLADETGRWILADHPEAACELALSQWVAGQPQTKIIDRTFVDREGQRWIIDYKTGYRAGGDIEGFLDQEVERHGPQLRDYARLLAATENRPLRLGLYFPLLGRFREVALTVSE